jgi:hypothetical protein
VRPPYTRLSPHTPETLTSLQLLLAFPRWIWRRPRRLDGSGGGLHGDAAFSAEREGGHPLQELVREIKDRHLPPRRGRLNSSYCSRRSAIHKFRFSSRLSSPLSVPNFPPCGLPVSFPASVLAALRRVAQPCLAARSARHRPWRLGQLGRSVKEGENQHGSIKTIICRKSPFLLSLSLSLSLEVRR